MPKVGIRELKNETSQIIRAVREEQARYVVTHRGEPVAVIIPVMEARDGANEDQPLVRARAEQDYWSRLDALAAEIDASWESNQTALELVEEQRREL